MTHSQLSSIVADLSINAESIKAGRVSGENFINLHFLSSADREAAVIKLTAAGIRLNERQLYPKRRGKNSIKLYGFQAEKYLKNDLVF